MRKTVTESLKNGVITSITSVQTSQVTTQVTTTINFRSKRMQLFLGVCAIVGFYFLLNFFPGLHTSVIGVAFGLTFTWFHALFFGGAAVIGWVSLK